MALETSVITIGGKEYNVKDATGRANLELKQDKLTAGNYIKIEDNVISADFILEDKVITKNGVYTSKKDGFNQITVNVAGGSASAGANTEPTVTKIKYVKIKSETDNRYFYYIKQNDDGTYDTTQIFKVNDDENNPLGSSVANICGYMYYDYTVNNNNGEKVDSSSSSSGSGSGSGYYGSGSGGGSYYGSGSGSGSGSTSSEGSSSSSSSSEHSHNSNPYYLSVDCDKYPVGDLFYKYDNKMYKVKSHNPSFSTPDSIIELFNGSMLYVGIGIDESTYYSYLDYDEDKFIMTNLKLDFDAGLDEETE